MVVAIAAPVNPNAGIGPRPLIKMGHKIILQIFASHKLFHCHRGVSCTTKNTIDKKKSMITKLPPIIILTNGVPIVAVSERGTHY